MKKQTSKKKKKRKKKKEKRKEKGMQVTGIQKVNNAITGRFKKNIFA